MAYKEFINFEIFVNLVPFNYEFSSFYKWFFIGWVARRESIGDFDDLSLQIICPPSRLEYVYEDHVFVKS